MAIHRSDAEGAEKHNLFTVKALRTQRQDKAGL